MSEKMSEVYEAYDMEILGAVRGRGSMILKTDQGIRQISPFDGSEERLEQEREHYMEDQLKPVLDYFRPYMDEKYLKELQIEDTEG